MDYITPEEKGFTPKQTYHYLMFNGTPICSHEYMSGLSDAKYVIRRTLSALGMKYEQLLHSEFGEEGQYYTVHEINTL